MARNIILTHDGYDKLQNELNDLKKNKRREVANRIQIAKDFGDLSENAEYSEAKDDQANLERRIAEIKAKLRTSEIVESSAGSSDIQIGSTFEVSLDGNSRTFSLVGKEESNPLEGKISFDSPLGAAFVSKKEGDVVEVTTPAGKKVYTIEKIT